MVQQETGHALERWIHEYEYDPEFIADGLAADVIEEALRLLQEGNHTQTWLAGEMGVSRAHVSRLFNAPPNLTLLSIARLGVALRVKPKILLDSGNIYIAQFPLASDPVTSYEEFKTDMAISRARAATDSIWNLSQSRRGEGTADATS